MASVLAPGGCFAFLDVVVPTTEVARPVPLEAGVDLPSTAEDQLGWLLDADLHPAVILAGGDPAVIAASARGA